MHTSNGAADVAAIRVN